MQKGGGGEHTLWMQLHYVQRPLAIVLPYSPFFPIFKCFSHMPVDTFNNSISFLELHISIKVDSCAECLYVVKPFLDLYDW